MKLVGSLTSPFVRKVRMVLAEKHIDCEFEVDIPWNADTKVQEMNPLGKVPVLVLDDCSTLFDSRVIVEYLDSIVPVNRLIPQESRPRMLVKRWEALADGVCDAAAAIFIERKRSEEMQSKEWLLRQHGKVMAGLEAMSEDLGDKTWCTGDHFTLADVAVGCSLGYLSFRFPEITWAQAHPNLGRLAEALAVRPSFSETVPQG